MRYICVFFKIMIAAGAILITACNSVSTTEKISRIVLKSNSAQEAVEECRKFPTRHTDSADDRENCLMKAAEKFQDTALCNDFSPPSFRNYCYLSIIEKSDNTDFAVCEKLDDFYKEDCKVETEWNIYRKTPFHLCPNDLCLEIAALHIPAKDLSLSLCEEVSTRPFYTIKRRLSYFKHLRFQLLKEEVHYDNPRNFCINRLFSALPKTQVKSFDVEKIKSSLQQYRPLREENFFNYANPILNIRFQYPVSWGDLKASFSDEDSFTWGDDKPNFDYDQIPLVEFTWSNNEVVMLLAHPEASAGTQSSPFAGDRLECYGYLCEVDLQKPSISFYSIGKFPMYDGDVPEHPEEPYYLISKGFHQILNGAIFPGVSLMYSIPSSMQTHGSVAKSEEIYISRIEKGDFAEKDKKILQEFNIFVNSINMIRK